MRANSAARARQEKGGRPVSISYSSAPSDHLRAGVEKGDRARVWRRGGDLTRSTRYRQRDSSSPVNAAAVPRPVQHLGGEVLGRAAEGVRARVDARDALLR